jgi:hypothetical protein
MKHPGHMYGGFVPAISERGTTLIVRGYRERSSFQWLCVKAVAGAITSMALNSISLQNSRPMETQAQILKTRMIYQSLIQTRLH